MILLFFFWKNESRTKICSPSLRDCSQPYGLRARNQRTPGPYSGRYGRCADKRVHANAHAHRPSHTLLCGTPLGWEVPPCRNTKPS